MECSNLCMMKISSIPPFFTFLLRLFFLLHMFIVFPSAFIPFMILFFFSSCAVLPSCSFWLPLLDPQLMAFLLFFPAAQRLLHPHGFALWLHTLDLISAVVTSPTPPPVWATTKCCWQSTGNIRRRDFQVCLLLCLHVEKVENKNGAYHADIYSVSCSVLICAWSTAPSGYRQ